MLTVIVMLFLLPPGADDERAIREAVKSFVQAVARSDWTGTTISGELGERRIWSETTPPLLEAGDVWLAAPDVAVVNATVSQYGSLLVVRRAPASLILSKHREGWRIVAWLPAALRSEYPLTLR